MRDALFGIAAFGVLALLAWKRPVVCRLLMMAAFLLGAVFVWTAEEGAPARPSWLVPRKSVLAEGVVAETAPLAGGRLRVVLESVRPLDGLPPMPEGQRGRVEKALARAVPTFPEGTRKGWQGEVFDSQDDPLSGRAVLTLDAGALGLLGGRPVSGDRLCALVRFFPSEGSINPGTSSLGRYWADRDVWYSARLVRDREGPLFLRRESGSGLFHGAAALREGWRTAFTSGPLYGDAGTDGEGLRPQGKAVVAALLFGDRSGLSPRTVDLFTRAGLVHSLALSGQHLALAAMAGLLAVFVVSTCFPRLLRIVPRRVFAVSAGLPFALAYLFIGGAPSSLIRAALMMGAGAFLLCLRRPSAPLDILFAAAALLFIARPLSVFDLSVQLSVLAVAGILLAMPMVGAFHRRLAAPDGASLPKRGLLAFLRWTGTMLLVSCAAQAAVLPLLADTFGAVSLCFWLNAVWLPPLTFVTLPLAALGLLSFLAGASSLSAILLSLAAWPAETMTAWLEWLDAGGFLPFVQCFRPVPLSALGYGILFAAAAFGAEARLCRRPAGRSVAYALTAGIVLLAAGQAPLWLDDLQARREDRVTLTLFDVGHGQSVLLEHRGRRILVDGGGSSSPFFDVGRSLVAPSLTFGRLPHLDAVMITHGDMDHVRGLRWILGHFTVGALYWSPVTASRATEGDSLALRRLAQEHGVEEVWLERGDRLEVGGGTHLEVLWPEAGAVGLPEGAFSDNDASLVLRLVREGQGLALLCGDLTARSQRRILRIFEDEALASDVLVLPHHGAASSCVPAFYDAAGPKAALASAASFSHYGFPSRKVRETLAERGIPLFSTSEMGAVRAVWKAGDGGRMDLYLPEAGTPSP